jgi:4-amino-4-deoxy-L-arabinose transferase-like glycosyltransferase
VGIEDVAGLIVMDESDDARKMSPRARFFMALAFFFFGGFLFSFVFGWIPQSPSPTPTPNWVLAATAAMFSLAGVMILLIENERLAWLRNLVSWLLVVCLAIPFNWVAFGAGERHFSSSSSFLGVTSNGAPGETEGRIVFGLFAILMDLMVVLAPLRFLKNRKPK